LLVVIAIVGILVALLMPAVQMARESARRTSCANHLHQIGVALHGYHAALGCFPPHMTGGGPKAANGEFLTGLYSWHAFLLPWLDQQALHESIDFRRNMADFGAQQAVNPRISAEHPNAAAAATPLATYLCPSDAPLATSVMGTARPAPGSYAANAGWPSRCTGFDGSREMPGRQNGFIGLVHPSKPVAWHTGVTREGQIVDGLSQTIAVAERLIATASKAAEIESAHPATVSRCGGSAGTKRTLAEYDTYCRYADPDITYTKMQGRAWISGSPLVANTFMPVLPINSYNAHLYDGETDGQILVTPSSHHAGGVNAMMADGRVIFLQDGIDMMIWWSLGTRNGQEPIAAEL